jgi:hypothetical protein
MPQWKSAVFCLGFLATLAACETLGPPDPLPDNALRLAVPTEYQAWWQATETCSGITGRLAHIEWYVVPDATTLATPEGAKVGVWSHSDEGMRVVLAGAYADNELVVRHEMLHALLDRPGHPKEYFQDRCHLTWETWGHTD